MNFIKKLSIVIIALLIPVILFESYLRIDGRYSSLVSTELYGSNTIWSRYPSETRYKIHPDKGSNIESKYYEFGAKGKLDFNIDLKNTSVGFFGDSFTENLRIENRFSFNSFLSELSKDTNLINLGVDGYGTAQSFQRWLNVKDILKLEVVVYIFCSNDLRNTYEAQIFDRDLFAKGKIKNIVPTDVPLLIALANSFHITYLAIEAYFKAKAIYNRVSNLQTSLYSARLADKFSSGKEVHRRKFHDEYADKILQEFLSDNPSEKTLETAKHFKQIVKKWQEMVEIQGGKFIVAVLPTKEGKLAAKKLFSNQEVVQLKSTAEIAQLENLPWKFNIDGHWNEYGNLAAAISLRDSLNEQEDMNFDPISIDWIEEKRSDIFHYYEN